MNRILSIGRIRRISLILLTMNTITAFTQDYRTGPFRNGQDIGHCAIPGHFSYNQLEQTFSLSGSGENIWGTQDQYFFLWEKLNDHFIIQARIAFQGEGKHEHRKIGIMLRKSLATDAPHVSGTVHGDGLTSLQFRALEGGETGELRSEVNGANIIRIEKKGDRIIFSCAVYGNEFDTLSVSDIKLGEEVYAGLFICSHDNSVLESAVFSNVRIIYPAADDFVPYQDYIGSNLEIMDMETGLRKMIFQSPVSIQAPNWTPDNKYLIYNSEGLLYRYELASGEVSVLPTGSAVNNNNDHVLSFDGSMLGISNHVKADGNRSVIFVLPSSGGEPRRVTSKSPSYLHGWSPDGKYLIYTAERKGEFDIYKIGVNGKKETRLTDTPGLDDGSEYSPDGNYIYFNSSRTGTMQIWRMRPDGSGQEQLTSGSLNDWFPHVSPDGKTLVFLSFPPDVDAADHPFYKHVLLRTIPAGGGEPRVVAYLYGGQGTINVPSWSPDGKKIAFVSNSILKK
ncbi:MAG: TolB family protein [Bacteroidota bacterium]